ncbi:membrane-associated guanylate kinase, WW and PDZ domain-containing protein 1-like [Ascaphus truei]|uniref:membrane-associated guanylate kinase, WW and PDZ domain-containing protein 1-like n=1 Tax=Ascaphus truei TaxID=8439 RepID=UPI003F5A7170
MESLIPDQMTSQTYPDLYSIADPLSSPEPTGKYVKALDMGQSDTILQRQRRSSDGKRRGRHSRPRGDNTISMQQKIPANRASAIYETGWLVNPPATLKTKLWMGDEGFGLVIIAVGSYLQIIDILDNSPGARNARLKPGDVLIKVGKHEVYGWTVRQLQQLLWKIRFGSVVEIEVYRNLVCLPKGWADVDETTTNITEEIAVKSAQVIGVPQSR